MRKEKGFSMLETIVVAGVVMVASAAAAPGIITASRQYQLKATAMKIDQALQAARYDAIRQNLPKTVTFNLATNQLIMSNNQVIQLPSGVTFATLGSTVNAPALVSTSAATATAANLPAQESNCKASCSFPAGANSNIRVATFTSRGIPSVAPGAFNWVYLKNTTTNELAVVTLSSTGSTAMLSKMYQSGWKGSTSTTVPCSSSGQGNPCDD
jgi:type II secretory pathway pseudopilin PulG